MTLGKAAPPGPEQFETCSRQLQRAASWIVVAPYFAQNYAGLLLGGPPEVVNGCRLAHGHSLL